MVACVLAFIGIYATVLGIAGIVLNVFWSIPVSGINLPISVICMVGGFLLSLCVLGYMRMMGELSGDEDAKVIQTTLKVTLQLGFIAVFVASAIQGFLRIEYLADKFFIHKSEQIASALKATEPTLKGILFCLSIAIPILIGLPVFIFLFFGQSFQEYVTVSYKEIGGMDIEMSRSESYLPIWPTLIIGLLVSAIAIFFAVTPLIFLLIVPFATYIFGSPVKKKMKTAAIISSIIVAVALILIFIL